MNPEINGDCFNRWFDFRSTEIKNKSRKFSQLPPASAESPLAVKMGSKFTMIPTDVRRQSIKEENEGNHEKESAKETGTLFNRKISVAIKIGLKLSN